MIPYTHANGAAPCDLDVLVEAALFTGQVLRARARDINWRTVQFWCMVET